MPATLASTTDHRRMWWCPDCEIYCKAHPLDHLDERHPPQHADGSRALPERLAYMGAA